jgi:hypothetical protein
MPEGMAAGAERLPRSCNAKMVDLIAQCTSMFECCETGGFVWCIMRTLWKSLMFQDSNAVDVSCCVRVEMQWWCFNAQRQQRCVVLNYSRKECTSGYPNHPNRENRRVERALENQMCAQVTQNVGTEVVLDMKELESKTCKKFSNRKNAPT